MVDSASRSRLHSPGVIGLATVLLLALLSSVPAAGVAAAPGGPRVLYVGAFRASTRPESSTFTTIQAAVDAAKPGDWILIAPGDYHERRGHRGPSAKRLGPLRRVVRRGRHHHTADPSRGMNRNSVIVDGTLARLRPRAARAAADQNTLNG